MAQDGKKTVGDAAATTQPSNPLITNRSVPEMAGVNRKKQKRREKQAAREAAERDQQDLDVQYASAHDATVRNGHVPQGRTTVHHAVPHHPPAEPQISYGYPDFDDPDQFEPAEGEDLYYSDEDGQVYQDTYGVTMQEAAGQFTHEYLPNNGATKPSKKKRKQKSIQVDFPYQPPPGSAPALRTPAASYIPPPPPPPPPLSSAAARTLHRAGTKDHIWNTSTQEERERIKEFWLSLGEEERKSLVKIEKEAVLRKMKEQQKHSCSCTVCGRKRTAIEEELEVLYDAYYEELEQYANHQQVPDGAPVLAPLRHFPNPMATKSPSNRVPPLSHVHQPSRGRIQEIPDDEDDEEEDEEGDEDDYSDDEEEDYSDEEPEEIPRGPAADFFNFGNSLTVKGGILTVADDLLKNDGKKFIEMMEQLAERRMQREEEAQYAASGLSHPSMQVPHPHANHNHGPPPEEEEYDDEEDEEYDSQEDYEEDEDEMDTMTKEQRMEEGRRMFQIFAARMFEQRVLTAYREKVARERQQKLLEELEEESRLDVQREAKKAREAQKKKDKKQQQKQAKSEEKAKRESEKAAEEAAVKAAEEKKQEEQRRKREEQRKRKEAEKRVQEEERQRKEAEKQRRQQEERERQQEAERKAREQKAQEKKQREEAKRREREEKEARELEAKEKRVREEKERKEKEAQEQAAKVAKEHAKREELAAQAPLPSKRPSLPAIVALPSGLQAKQAPPGFSSPHIPVATPNLPKAPTPNRPRQASGQGSHASSPKTPHILPRPKPSISPPAAVTTQNNTTARAAPSRTPNHHPANHQPQPQPVPPMHPVIPPPGMHHPHGPGFTMPHIGANGFPNPHGPMMHVLNRRAPPGQNVPMFSPQGPVPGQYRLFVPPPGMPGPPPGVSGVGAHFSGIPHGRGYPLEAVSGPPLHNHAIAQPGPMASFSTARDSIAPHSRQQSVEKSSPIAPTPAAQPIGRPAPIQGRSSVKPEDSVPKNRTMQSEMDELSSHLGSSALLHDSEETGPSRIGDSRRASVAPGSSLPGKGGFQPSPLFTDHPSQLRIDPFGLSRHMGPGSNWNTPTFSSPALSGGPGWGNLPGSGWPAMNSFGTSGGLHRSNMTRPMYLRILLCQACKQLNANQPTPDGYHDAEAILRQVESIRPVTEPPVQMEELLQLCETEGDAQNGGGSFTTREDHPDFILVRYEPDNSSGPMPGRGGAGLGEIGSPVPGNSIPAFGGPRAFQPLGGISSPGF